MAAFGSILKQVIKELPEEFGSKAASVAPMLLKKGVKQEELTQSGILLPKVGKTTKQDLVKAEAARTDKFYTTISKPTAYENITVGEVGIDNPTYREKVLQFNRVDGVPIRDEYGLDVSRYTSDHFEDVPNYLMHTRIHDETMDGTPTRILTEIQSDLHQQGRQGGYNPESISLSDSDARILRDSSNTGYADAASTYGINVLDEGAENKIELLLSKGGVEEIPQSPYEKTWLRKGIEREVSDAVGEGRSQLAIPISGKVGDLARAPGVQKWYETQVVNTAKKVAKQSGGTFELKTVGAKQSNIPLTNDDLIEVRRVYKEEGVLDRGDGYDAALNLLYKKLSSGAYNKDAIIGQILKGKTIEDINTNLSNPGVTYAVIKPGAKTDFALYSSPTAGAFVAYQAYKAGMTEEQVNAKLVERGYDEEDIAEVSKRVDVITQASAAGMSMDEIKQKMDGREITATTETSEPAKGTGYWPVASPLGPTLKQASFEAITDETNDLTAEELISSMKVLHPTMVSDTLTTIPTYFGNKGAQQRYDKARESSRTRIVNLAKQNYNLDIVWQPAGVGTEGWYAQTPEGMVEITPGFWEDFKKSTGEITGGIAGAIAGAKTGARTGASVALALGQAGPQAALPEEVATVPIGAALGGVIGAAVGGWLGASTGSQADYLFQAMKLQEDMDAEAMAYRALNAFEAASIGETIGYPIIKGLGKGWNGIIKAKEAIAGGEAKAAYQSIKDTTFLSDDQIGAIVMQLEKHANLTGNQYEKSIQAIALTEPGMQDLVRAAGGTHPKASSATAHVVRARAEDVLNQTAQLTDEQVPRMLAMDLQSYVGDVKDQYARVKAQATQSPRGLDFSWDFEELAIKPVMGKLEKQITDPATKEKFLLQMRRVNTLSESRNFGDLIELRQMVNDFLYNKRIIKADDKSTLRGVIGNIDSAIEDGAGSVLEHPQQWLDNWSTARTDYSKMKQIEKTAMFRAMFNKDGTQRAVQPETVVKSLGKYITSIDGSFEDVMSKLPIAGRKMYEGAVVDSLAKRYTAGIDKGSKAIHFPMLADELKKINFTTPDARATKNALIELGETFKNDVWLAQTAGQITIPKFQSYLTIDPVVRAKFEVASGIFNYIKSKAPGDSNRQLALVRATSKLLEKPLDAKNFKSLQDDVFDDANLSRQVLDLQQEAARNRMKEVEVGTPKVKVYVGGKLKGAGSSTTIPMHRILTLQQAKDIAASESLSLDNKSLDAILQQYGYKAILQGSDRVRILGSK